MLQRFFTRSEAMEYLAMNEREWYAIAEPHLTNIPTAVSPGKKRYSRLQLDALAAKMEAASGCPEEEIWDTNHLGSANEAKLGGSIRSLEIVTGKRE